VFSTIVISAYLRTTRAAEVVICRLARAVRQREERGQASAEYALVLLGSALLALFLGKWLMDGGTLKKIFADIISKITADMP
jgi:hypothetical protein